MGILASAATGQQAALQLTEPQEEDLRLLEVMLDRIILLDSLAGYAGAAGGTLLPLQTVSDLLGVAITTSPSEGIARGFVLDESRSFHLDVARREVTIGGRQRTFNAELVRIHTDDIYVDSALLGEWLPIAFDIDLFALRLTVRPREQLPLQRRLDRERRIRLFRLRLGPADPGYPRMATPYSFMSIPFVDQRLRISTGRDTTFSHSTYATGDFLFMDAEGYLAGGDDELVDTARLTLRRRDPDSGIGGWLGATEVALGHVIHPASSLLSNTSQPLPGVLLTNRPLNRASEFDRHAFRGTLPAGWDVELHHNDSLIDYQQSGPDGEYFFDNVPILVGMNYFRLVFYGPQGQRREEVHRFLLGDSLTLPGRFDYRVVANAGSETDRRASAALSYGLNRNVTASAELASLPTPDGERQYAKAGLRAFRGSLFAYGDVVRDDAGGTAWEGGMQTRILGANLLFSHQELSRGFVSEAFQGSLAQLVTRDRLRLDTAIPASILPRIGISVEVERQGFESGAHRIVGRNRLSSNYKGLSITNRLALTSMTGGSSLPADVSRLTGSLQLSRSIRRTRVRGELAYALGPSSLTATNIVLERSLGAGYRVFASVSRSLIVDDTTYSVGFDKSVGSFAAGATTSRTSDGDLVGNIELYSGIGNDARAGTWNASARGRARFGAASVRLFLDLNEDGRFDANDQPLPGVGITVNGVGRPERSGENGIVFVPELMPYQATNLAVDARTLDDPQWVPDVAGVKVMPRPGKSITIDVPVVQTAEIEGTVFTTSNGTRREVGGAAIELLDSAGNVVKQTSTAFDGFYVITHVRRGSWRVRVTPAPRTVLSVALRSDALEKSVVVTGDEPVIVGIDFSLPGTDVPVTREPVMVAQEEIALPPMEAVIARGGFAVQLGSFSVEANARRLVEQVRGMIPDATVTREGAFWVVRSGHLTRPAASALARELANRGIEAMVVQSAVSGGESRKGAFVVQLGAFSVVENAHNLVRRLEQAGVKADLDRRGTLYFVQTPPLATHDAAAEASESLRRLGFSGIVREVDLSR